ncbi:TPA: tyrosine-type recombinase/integrase [Escherichia coli]|nr:tyrosine-type recombinase/integrase [Escherichia coli]
MTGDDNVSRRYLSENEIRLILDTAQQHSLRNYCMIYLAFIHGLRVSELLSLQLTDYDPRASTLSIRRLKGGLSTIHPLSTEECHIISQWLQVRLRSPYADSPWLFPSRNGHRITRQRFWQIIRAYGVMAGLAVRVHPHMLRHSCGFALAERGNDIRLIQDYLGHKNIHHTVRYTATSPARFRQAWIHPPCHTLSPDNTPPEHDFMHTGYHIRSSSAHVLPPHLSVIHHEYGNMMKNICRELDNIQHILKRMDARATVG